MSQTKKIIHVVSLMLSLQVAANVSAAPILWPVSKVTFNGARGAWIEHSGLVGGTSVEVDLKFDSTTQVAELAKTLDVSFKRHALQIVDQETVRITFDGQIQGTAIIRYFDPNATSARSYTVELDLDQDSVGLADATRISEIVTYHNNTRYSWASGVSIYDTDALQPGQSASGPVPERQSVRIRRSETVVLGLITRRSIVSNKLASGNSHYPTRTINLKHGWPAALTNAGPIVFRDASGYLLTENVSRFAAVTDDEKYTLPTDLSVRILVKEQKGIDGGRRGNGYLEYDNVRHTAYHASNANDFDIDIELEHECSSGYTVISPGPCGPNRILPLPIRVTANSQQVAMVTETAKEKLLLRITESRDVLRDVEQANEKLAELSKKLKGSPASVAPFVRKVNAVKTALHACITGLRRVSCIRSRIDKRKVLIASSERPSDITFTAHLANIDAQLKALSEVQLPELSKRRAELITAFNKFANTQSKGIRAAVSRINNFACDSKVQACDCAEVN